MERLTEWNGGQTRHAYYPRCFKEPCYGGGCKIKDCAFEAEACDRLAAYEDTRLSPERIAHIAISARAASDLELIRPYEPNVVKAAWAIFGDSYRYRAKYNEYKAMRREQEKAAANAKPKELSGQMEWEDTL